MKRILITDAAMAAIRSAVAAGHDFAQEGRRTAPNEWSVPLQDDTFARLTELRLAGETYSDTIIRAIATLQKRIN